MSSIPHAKHEIVTRYDGSFEGSKQDTQEDEYRKALDKGSTDQNTSPAEDHG